jgi:hypothetical protein
MKRCPLCDFIYEDEQSLCDMDGIPLVDDAEELQPLKENVETQPTSVKANFSLKRFSALKLAGAILVAALLAAYIFTNQIASLNTSQPLTSVVAGPQSAPDPVSEMTDNVATTVEPTKTNVKTTGNTSATVKRAPAQPQSSTARQEKKNAKTENTNHKKESKVSSVLKKTGRILKRPFKF